MKYSKSRFSFRENKTGNSTKSYKIKHYHFRFFFRSVFISPNEMEHISKNLLIEIRDYAQHFTQPCMKRNFFHIYQNDIFTIIM